MAQRAQIVVRLLEDLRRINMGLLPLPPNQQAPQMQQNGQANGQGVPVQHGQQQHGQPMHVATPPEDPRPPKRPWEDISQDGPDASVSISYSHLFSLDLRDTDYLTYFLCRHHNIIPRDGRMAATFTVERMLMVACHMGAASVALVVMEMLAVVVVVRRRGVRPRQSRTWR